MAEDARVEIASAAELDDWLRGNHDRAGSVWLITWKAYHPDRHVSYRTVVETLIAWGWIDSMPRALDDDRSMRRISRRRQESGWSAVNKRIAQNLIAAGRMERPGQAAIEAARTSGAWQRLDAVEAGAIPPDLTAAFRQHAGSAETFANFPRSARRAILEWIGNAKTAPTRSKRIEQTAADAARGIRANQPRQPGGDRGRRAGRSEKNGAAGED